jgi:predicted esterase
MKRLACIFLLLLFSTILISCTQSTQTPMPSVEMIRPGDKIGDMSVVQGTYPYPFKYPTIWEYCEFLLDDTTEPVNLSSECTVPKTPGLALSFGWVAEEALFESSWNAMTIEFYIDGYKLDLEQFDWEDGDSPEMGADVKNRYIAIYLGNLTQGQHTFKVSMSTETPVDTGLEIMQPGIQEHIVNFTVAEPEIYPTLSTSVSSGQHRYRSEEAGLDYILYVPDDYGVDPQDKWPLILVLHGLDVGVMNSMDKLEKTLPLPPENQSDFPFIIVYPQGTFEHSDYEIWSTDEMINALMTLLDEVNDFVAVDSSHIYLTGGSAGGNGTWGVGLQHPDYFAALVPVAGYYGWPPTVPENICDLKDVPVWAFHGAEDEVLPLEAEQMLVDALKACGGNVQFTIFPDIGHDVDSRQVYTSELFTWLLVV